MTERNDEARIRAALENWAKAVRAKDADGVLRVYADDVVSFDLAPPLKQTGADRQGLEAWFATWQGPIEYEITDLSITARDGLAYSRSLNRIGGTKVDDGQPTSIWVRATVCFEMRSGAWKVVHEHSSVPLYMDGSGKAAADLQPEE